MVFGNSLKFNVLRWERLFTSRDLKVTVNYGENGCPSKLIQIKAWPESFPTLLSAFLPLLQSVSLLISPNRSQFFRYESISLSCEGQLNSTSWKPKRKTKDSGVGACSSGWGHYSSGSTCTIRNTYPPDSGEYWCESDTREQSRIVNITITGRAD